MPLSIPLSFILAIEAAESNGDPSAVGDGGRSLGALQIQRAVVTDVNERFGTDYRWSDAHDREKSRAIFVLYLNRYCTEERLGRPPLFSDAARIWNGGPNGYKKTATLRYWGKINHPDGILWVDSSAPVH